MKASLHWMKQYGGQGLDVPIDELIERIGAQLGAVEEVESLGEKYQGVRIAKIMECSKHQDSDHLNVCKIDDGGKTEGVERDEHGYVQVVCGAPNVREGLVVAWLPPGTTVPESVGKEPFILGKRELRGVVSNGMLASSRELALGDDHDGIMELTGDVQPGDDFAVAYGLDDHLITIENKMFTHRPDCFGQLGVAREIAGISGQQFTSPDWYLHTMQEVLGVDGPNLPLEVRNEIPELVPRFLVVPLNGITIKPSPTWLQTQLLRVGVRPINNVVDITNYMMLLTGQPLHAYDYDKVKAQGGGNTAVLIARNPRVGETLALLNGKTITPRDEAIIIATEAGPIAIGGVMGGNSTEVDQHTTSIILECASFDMYSIRRTAMAHGLFTDAVTRFNKGQSPLQNDEVSAKAVAMLRELASATVAGPVIDNNHVDEQSRERRWVHPPVPVTTEFINARLGFGLSAGDMKRLLENVECSVETDGDSLTVSAPFWRTDIETREDVVEEIGRLYGFDKLPQELPQRSILPATKDMLLELKSKVRAVLARAGANEVLTYSFVHGDLMNKVGQDKEQAFQIGNALSPDLQYYRLSLTPSLLDKIHLNIKAGYDEFALFELGKAHGKSELDTEGLPKEFDRVAFVVGAEPKTAARQYHGAPYYQARKVLTNLVSAFDGTGKLVFAAIGDNFAEHIVFQQMIAPFEPNRSALVYNGEQLMGVVGEYKRSVARALKLPEFCAGFELFGSAFSKSVPTSYVPLPRFPKVSQDITLKVASDIPYQTLHDLVWSELSKVQPEQVTVSVQPVDIYQRADDTAHKQVTLRVAMASYLKTLTDAEVTRLLDEVSGVAHTTLGAERI